MIPRRTLVAIGVVFAAIVMGYGLWVAFASEIGAGADSRVYMASSRRPPWSRAFGAGPGPLGFLVLAKVCLQNYRAIVIAQSAAYAACWLWLALSFVSVTRNRVTAWIALLTPLCLALAPPFLEWNAFISTESLSLTTLALCIAFGLRFAMSQTRRDTIGLAVSLGAFAFVRDTNAYEVAVVGVFLLGLGLVRRGWRGPASIVGGTALGAATIALSLSAWAQPPRWYWPVAETVAVRLLDDPGARDYLIERGLPYDDALARLPSQYIYLAPAVTNDAEYAAFREWVRTKGRRTYVQYLLSEPWWSLARPFDERHSVLTPGIEGYSSKIVHNHPGVTVWIGKLGAPWSEPFLEIWLVGALAAVVVLRRRVSLGPIVVAAVVGVTAVGAYYLAWHGDALEIDRHSLVAAVQLRLALWLATLLAVDAFLAGRREPSATIARLTRGVAQLG